MSDRIEILSVNLLDQHRPLVNDLRRLARRLGLEFGWHYLLDLVWILGQLGDVAGQVILDAGAGVGVMQWCLAGRGATVYSVDRESRALLPMGFRARHRIKGMRPEDLRPALDVMRQAWVGPANLLVRAVRWIRSVGAWALGLVLPRAPGEIIVYNQDLSAMPHILDASVDAVVAVSALEHNRPEDLPRVVDELLRVLKPNGVLLATLGAACDRDWYHEPSSGWCYTEGTLRQAFRLSVSAPSNFDRYDELMAALQDCAELREGLAPFYFRSGNNGMPWGNWDPQYHPVGVRKVKA